MYVYVVYIIYMYICKHIQLYRYGTTKNKDRFFFKCTALEENVCGASKGISTSSLRRLSSQCGNNIFVYARALSCLCDRVRCRRFILS